MFSRLDLTCRITDSKSAFQSRQEDTLLLSGVEEIHIS
jgi:hypothetical protein